MKKFGPIFPLSRKARPRFRMWQVHSTVRIWGSHNWHCVEEKKVRPPNVGRESTTHVSSSRKARLEISSTEGTILLSGAARAIDCEKTRK